MLDVGQVRGAWMSKTPSDLLPRGDTFWQPLPLRDEQYAQENLAGTYMLLETVPSFDIEHDPVARVNL